MEAIIEIENYTFNKDYETFLADSMMRFASIKQLEIIGEAANYISEEIKTQFSDIEWQQMVGMRHILIHEYFGVASPLVWQVIINDIPELKIKIERVITTLN